MMNHFPERKLKPNDKKDKTRVVWSRHDAQNAVVFVHGYNGKALKTWSQFELMLPYRPRAKDYDLFFYGYNCFDSNITAEGLLLCKFLNLLFSSPRKLISGSIPRETGMATTFRYNRVILVGHSIGAIVCRRALLNALDKKYLWMPQTKMVLFAPAHNGAIISSLLNNINHPWLNFAVNVYFYFSPLAVEVLPDSDTIKDLKDETIDAVNQGANYLKATKVVIAEIDHIVSNRRFDLVDPLPSDPQIGTTHETVCKPHAGFSYPVDQVEEVM